MSTKQTQPCARLTANMMSGAADRAASVRPDEECRAALSRLGAPHSSKDGRNKSIRGDERVARRVPWLSSEYS